MHSFLEFNSSLGPNLCPRKSISEIYRKEYVMLLSATIFSNNLILVESSKSEDEFRSVKTSVENFILFE